MSARDWAVAALLQGCTLLPEALEATRPGHVWDEGEAISVLRALEWALNLNKSGRMALAREIVSAKLGVSPSARVTLAPPRSEDAAPVLFERGQRFGERGTDGSGATLTVTAVRPGPVFLGYAAADPQTALGKEHADMSDREPSCAGCGAVAVADGRCSYCRERFGVPLAMVRVDASCDPGRAYLLEERGEWFMVVHPSLEREKWPFVFAGLWAVRERFGAAGAASPEATLNRLTLAVTAVAKRLPHVIEGDPSGYHAGLVEAFDGLMVALQGVPAPGERAP